MASYNYTKSSVYLTGLEDAIRADSVITETLLYSKFEDPDDLIIFFDPALSEASKSELDQIVANYTNPSQITDIVKFQIDQAKYDADGHLLISHAADTNLTSPQWFTPEVDGMGDHGTFFSTGNGTTDYIDIKFNTDTMLETGILHIDPNTTVAFGVDVVNAYYIDIDNVLGYGNNLVLFQFLKNIKVRANYEKVFDDPNKEPLNILAGLYIRIEYKAKSGSPSVGFIPEFKIRL